MEKRLFDAAGSPLPNPRPSAPSRAFRVLKRGILPAIPIVALIVSLFSLFISMRTERRAAALSQLDHDPMVFLRAELGNSARIPPQVVLDNFGPMAATAIGVRLISHGYDPETRKLRVHRQHVDYDRTIPSLGPNETVAIPIDPVLLRDNVKLDLPLKHNVLEIRLTYRRAIDLKQYDKSAFYFLAPDGRWCTEGNVSIQGADYKDIVAAAEEFSSRNGFSPYYRGFAHDPMRENKRP